MRAGGVDGAGPRGRGGGGAGSRGCGEGGAWFWRVGAWPGPGSEGRCVGSEQDSGVHGDNDRPGAAPPPAGRRALGSARVPPPGGQALGQPEGQPQAAAALEPGAGGGRGAEGRGRTCAAAEGGQGAPQAHLRGVRPGRGGEAPRTFGSAGLGSRRGRTDLARGGGGGARRAGQAAG